MVQSWCRPSTGLSHDDLNDLLWLFIMRFSEDGIVSSDKDPPPTSTARWSGHPGSLPYSLSFLNYIFIWYLSIRVCFMNDIRLQFTWYSRLKISTNLVSLPLQILGQKWRLSHENICHRCVSVETGSEISHDWQDPKAALVPWRPWCLAITFSDVNQVHLCCGQFRLAIPVTAMWTLLL